MVREIRKNGFRRLFLAFFMLASAAGSPAFSQTTPTELIDLSLEDLLNLDISDTDSDEPASRWEFGLSYTKGSFGEYRSGTESLTFQDVLFSPGENRTAQNFPVVPTFIDQSAINLSATYYLSNKTALSVSVPYISQSTDHISSVPGFDEFILKTKGIGDVAVSIAYGEKLSKNGHFSGVVGVKIPVGSIDETGDTPRNGTGTLERLPYTMQLGSGSIDLTGSLTYAHNIDSFRTGVNIKGTFRTERNKHDYRLGHNVGAAIFARYAKHPAFQPGVRLSARYIGRVGGGDRSLQVPGPFPFPASITDPGNYGGEKISAAATVKSCVDTMCKLSFSADYRRPLYQHLNGVQPEERSSFSLGSAIKF